jgi:hypothetical protein
MAQQLQGEWLLVSITEDISRLNGNVYWRLTFLNVIDNTIWETTVDGTYRNFSRSGWDRIVSDPNPWAIYTGLRRSKRTARSGNGVITADSRPEKAHAIESLEEVEKIVEGILTDVTDRRNRSDFSRLFD